MLARYRAEWPWWDDLHALWCERPNFNPPGVQNSTTKAILVPEGEAINESIPIDPKLLEESEQPFDWSPTQQSSQSHQPTSSTLQSRTSSVSGEIQSAPTTQSSINRKPLGKRVKIDPIEKLKTSVKELADMETVKAKEAYAYKRYKLDMQNKAQDQAFHQALEEKRLRFQA